MGEEVGVWHSGKNGECGKGGSGECGLEEIDEGVAQCKGGGECGTG